MRILNWGSKLFENIQLYREFPELEFPNLSYFGIITFYMNFKKLDGNCIKISQISLLSQASTCDKLERFSYELSNGKHIILA